MADSEKPSLNITQLVLENTTSGSPKTFCLVQLSIPEQLRPLECQAPTPCSTRAIVSLGKGYCSNIFAPTQILETRRSALKWCIGGKLSWGEAQASAKDRTLWRNIVVALCPTADEEDR